MSLLDDDRVREAVRKAWLESQPGSHSAYEEGGFILRAEDGSILVERWPSGADDTIDVPPHPSCLRGKSKVVATFHTHPNPGLDFLQEPSLTDIRAVRDDPDLRDVEYEGEFVVSRELIYRIRNTGLVDVVGSTDAFLRLTS